MIIKNKTEKILGTIIGILVLVLFTMGIKIKDDREKMSKIKEDLSKDSAGDDISAKQVEIEKERETTLGEVAHSPGSKTNESTTTTQVIPGAIIKRTETTTSSSSSSSSGSSSKTSTS